MSSNEVAVNTINPVRGAVEAALRPENLQGVLIEGTATRVRAIPPLALVDEDVGWLTRHLTERLVNGTLKPGEIVFNRYTAWSVSGDLSVSATGTVLER